MPQKEKDDGENREKEKRVQYDLVELSAVGREGSVNASDGSYTGGGGVVVELRRRWWW